MTFDIKEIVEYTLSSLMIFIKTYIQSIKQRTQYELRYHHSLIIPVPFIFFTSGPDKLLLLLYLLSMGKPSFASLKYKLACFERQNYLKQLSTEKRPTINYPFWPPN